MCITNYKTATGSSGRLKVVKASEPAGGPRALASLEIHPELKRLILILTISALVMLLTAACSSEMSPDDIEGDPHQDLVLSRDVDPELDPHGGGEMSELDRRPLGGRETRDAYVERDQDLGVDANVERDQGLTGDEAGDNLAGDEAGDEPNSDAHLGPVLYPDQQVYTPITHEILTTLTEMMSRDELLNDNVFIKVGASSTVSRNTLTCFARDEHLWGAHEALEPTLNFFLSGDAAGRTPFDRETVAARVGHSAGWVIDGDPSPLIEEYQALLPRFALIHYGTNDMGLGATYASAMRSFYDHMVTLMEELTRRGVIPILTGISARGDRASADVWVESYNAVIRGLAQRYQIPFIDLWYAVRDLEGRGLASDGLHLNRAPTGACDLTREGLAYGYNVRNLIVLTALDKLIRALALGGLDQLDITSETESASRLSGDGSHERPHIISMLPFSHTADTSIPLPHSPEDMSSNSTRPEQRFTTYSCAPMTDEGGAEVIYQLEVTEVVHIRALVLDTDDVDIDLHLLTSLTEQGGVARDCAARDHHMIEGMLAPGTYYFVLDTWVNRDGRPQSGMYQFTLVLCDSRDDACDEEL